jgi:Zn-dependent protease with chaperone function
MHTQTSRPQISGRGGVAYLGTATGLLLYLGTLAIELLLGASTRCLLVYLAAAIAGGVVPLGLSGETCAWFAALAPVGWSLLGLLLPGRGWVWGRRLGLRRPSDEERSAIEVADETLRAIDPKLGRAIEYRVLDSAVPFAAARGRVIVLSRPVVEMTALTAVLAHERGHVDSLDARLTEALNRLSLWDDPLSLSSGHTDPAPPAAPFDDSRGAASWGLLRLIARLSGGNAAVRLLAPVWAAYWRTREYAADSYAVSLGQGEDLASFLCDQELALDVPAAGFLPDRQHPPVALRIEHLLGDQSGGGSI